MKKILLSVILFISISSCSKDRLNCYECDFQKNGNYSDAGCFTSEQWDGIMFTDNTGSVTLDKERYCRKK